MQKFHLIPGLDFSFYRDQSSYRARSFSYNQILELFISASLENKTIYKTESRNSTLSIHVKIQL